MEQPEPPSSQKTFVEKIRYCIRIVGVLLLVYLGCWIGWGLYSSPRDTGAHYVPGVYVADHFGVKHAYYFFPDGKFLLVKGRTREWKSGTWCGAREKGGKHRYTDVTIVGDSNWDKRSDIIFYSILGKSAFPSMIDYDYSNDHYAIKVAEL